MDEGYFGERVTATYDAHSGTMFDPQVVGPATERHWSGADRWGGWRREPFTSLGPAHVSVYEKI